MTGFFLGGIYSSMFIYRVFLDPLNRFPGPWLARLSVAHFTTQRLNRDGYYVLERLHKKYGPIFRIGSGDLSIAGADFMMPTFGADSKVTKSIFYDGDYPHKSMQFERDLKKHAQRRKTWAPAFSDKAIPDYKTKVSALNNGILQRVRQSTDQKEKIDVSLFFNLWSFDVMARLTFGKDYGMLDKGEKHWALTILNEGMEWLAYHPPHWLSRTLRRIPGATKEYDRSLKFCAGELAWRASNADSVNEKGSSDIMSWLLEAYTGEEKPDENINLRYDTGLLIIAGPDTSAAALTYLFYHLAQDPQQVTKLREELRPLT